MNVFGGSAKNDQTLETTPASFVVGIGNVVACQP